jgi:hypothetical protein
MSRFGKTWALGAVFAAGSCVGPAAANNVQAAIEGSLLTVIGDNFANDVSIVNNAAGDVIVRGNNGTLVNGLPSVRFPRTPLNAVEVRMGDGNDTVRFNNLVVANDVFVEMGLGNDRVLASSPLRVGNNFEVQAGEGNDVVRMTDLEIGVDAKIEGGLGTLNATLTGASVGGNATIVGDDANDVVTVSGEFGGDILIETKKGADRVSMQSATMRSLYIATDEGADSVTLAGVSTTEDIGVFTGMDNDAVSLTSVASGKSITVSVDDGSDTVYGQDVLANQDAIFEGGFGTDTITDLGIVGVVKKDVKEFEIFLP